VAIGTTHDVPDDVVFNERRQWLAVGYVSRDCMFDAEAEFAPIDGSGGTLYM
jgi:hypothetical protein